LAGSGLRNDSPNLLKLGQDALQGCGISLRQLFKPLQCADCSTCWLAWLRIIGARLLESLSGLPPHLTDDLALAFLHVSLTTSIPAIMLMGMRSDRPIDTPTSA